jgi:hypothetical protein
MAYDKTPKTTTKMSTPLRTGNARYNKPASDYAPAHRMDGSKITEKDMASANLGMNVVMPSRKNWTPLNGGVSIGNFDEVKTEGVVPRGTGSAERGIKSRGPMA